MLTPTETNLLILELISCNLIENKHERFARLTDLINQFKMDPSVLIR